MLKAVTSLLVLPILGFTSVTNSNTVTNSCSKIKTWGQESGIMQFATLWANLLTSWRLDVLMKQTIISIQSYNVFRLFFLMAIKQYIRAIKVIISFD